MEAGFHAAGSLIRALACSCSLRVSSLDSMHTSIADLLAAGKEGGGSIVAADSLFSVHS